MGVGLCSGEKIGIMSGVVFQLSARPQRIPTPPRGQDLGKEVKMVLGEWVENEVQRGPR